MASRADVIVRFGGDKTAVDKTLGQIRQGVKGMGGELRGVLGTLGLGIGAGAMVSGFIQANKAIQSTRLALEAVFESGQQAAESMAWLDSLADRLGLSVSILNEQFVLLAASTKGTALEGQATRDIFESVVASMAKLGRTAEETKRALMAVSQMASKGTVAMEELRGQLGEALPGAMQAMAKGLGLTVQQLGDLVATGKLAAKDALPALKKGLDETFSLKADDRINSLTASIERFWNAVNRSFTQTGEAGLIGALGTIIDSAGTVVSVISTQTVAIGRMSAAVAAYASGAIGSLAELEAELQRIQQDAMERAFGAIPAFDPNAPAKPETESEKPPMTGAPTQEGEKKIDDAMKAREAAKDAARLKDMTAAQRQWELESRIMRALNEEKAAIAKNDEERAKKAQAIQEETLRKLIADPITPDYIVEKYRKMVTAIEAAPGPNVKLKIEWEGLSDLPKKLQDVIMAPGSQYVVPIDMPVRPYIVGWVTPNDPNMGVGKEAQSGPYTNSPLTDLIKEANDSVGANP